ncbi:MAG: putative DNA binding domain-containing protein [Oscillospiraceae bacterium]|jgi:ATP-dependent DNA helicase RecG|nr:putative DNA binding domain-containing protein [Oscillospiraceae bacterium]
MKFAESVTCELKSQFTDEIKRTAVAFANTGGGKIYVGIDNDSAIVGLDDPDFTARQVGDSIRNSVKPDITHFMQVDIAGYDGKNVVVVTIERGVYAPYYLAERGLKPSGVFVRVGSATVPATDEHIRRMIRDADGERYLTARSLIQELTFTRTAEEFSDKKFAFELPQQQSLGIIGENGIYTNLGLLLSEQCQHTVKVAVFEGTSKSIFKSRKEFGGSLIQQLYDVIEYVDYFNLVQAKIGMVRRVERRDYPIDAIREAVLNMLVHREYALSASSFVNVYDDRMEFLSVGGLAPGISLDAILSGVSHTRNEGLANIFYRLELVEAYGTGIVRIMGDYADCKRKPEINVTDTSFMLVLPNTRYEAVNAPPSEQERTVMALIKRDGYATAKSLGQDLGLGATQSYNILKRMTDTGKLTANRNGHRIEYRDRSTAE